MTLIDVGGLPTWYAEYGDGEPLVYLHGGFSSSREFAPVREAYAERFHVFTPDRRGHGHTPDVPGPFSYELYAEDAVAFLDEVVGGPAHLVGYSDGAITALLVGLARPDLVRRMVLISGQFHQNGLIPAFFHGPDAVAELQESVLGVWYAEDSPDGGEHFPVVAAKIIESALTGPTLAAEQLAGVPARTLVLSGDDDAITLEHTIEMYRSLPEAELAVVPGTSHVLVMEKPALVTQLVLDFLTSDAAPTIMPIRRA
ncbi:alpha/beta fold hydrolase [Pseudonocardia cypriaca]|uniref:Pimeloyl-ACP methyl ester carboxylesterase n=1 Tax=Pseudonocardia cypriaca TaxID=882449 RepID=A0A543GBS8_9PSEU|nr:alpha/beta hydrolase [Pseudonocardia cypriaca]TQM43532.1 pimeloyl-ACP methyl ester carboxylesterase [Pseudonocardia cypriaca]